MDLVGDLKMTKAAIVSSDNQYFIDRQNESIDRFCPEALGSKKLPSKDTSLAIEKPYQAIDWTKNRL